VKGQAVDISAEQLERVAKVLKTIAHPVKLQILSILAEEAPMDVTSLCARVGMGCQISMMSHHLAKMKDNGVLVSEKSGKQVYYRVADKNLLNIFNCISLEKPFQLTNQEP